MKKHLFGATMICVTMILGLVAYPYLSPELPIHWGLGGADFFANKSIAIFIIPIVMIVFYLVTTFSTKNQTSEQNKKLLPKITKTTLFILFSLHLFILSFGINMDFDNNFFSGFLIGIVILLLANPMQKTRPNVIYGLRTPWTLKDERVWKKANTFSGRLLFVVGLLIIGLSFITPQYIATIAVTLILIVALISVIFSYVVYRDLNVGVK